MYLGLLQSPEGSFGEGRCLTSFAYGLPVERVGCRSGDDRVPSKVNETVTRPLTLANNSQPNRRQGATINGQTCCKKVIWVCRYRRRGL